MTAHGPCSSARSQTLGPTHDGSKEARSGRLPGHPGRAGSGRCHRCGSDRWSRVRLAHGQEECDHHHNDRYDKQARAERTRTLPLGPGSPFAHHKPPRDVVYIPQTVIPATVRMQVSAVLPDYGKVQFWAARTKQGGACAAIKLPDGHGPPTPSRGT